MQIVVLANERQKNELLSNGVSDHAEIHWVGTIENVMSFTGADAIIDLQFEKNDQRVGLLSSLLPKTILVNAVNFTLLEINNSFIRINGWNTFLSSATIESAAKASMRKDGEAILAVFHKKPHWLPDQPGFITPRVVSMIINEAFLAFAEGVSVKQDIDTAMKLGTNYPYGPFEWAELIGRENIAALLKKLSLTQPRYQPAAHLFP